jgi:hypothetical protein
LQKAEQAQIRRPAFSQITQTQNEGTGLWHTEQVGEPAIGVRDLCDQLF